MFSRIQAWNSYMIGLFIQKSHFHPYSIHSRFANEKIFCLLCLQAADGKFGSVNGYFEVNKMAGWGVHLTCTLNWPVITQLSLESFWSSSWACWLCLETTLSLTQSLNTWKEMTLSPQRTALLTLLLLSKKFHFCTFASQPVRKVTKI